MAESWFREEFARARARNASLPARARLVVTRSTVSKRRTATSTHSSNLPKENTGG